jgi:hypothetical protein
MAKGKHSAALFEVINSSKRPERVAQSLRTPMWWFKGRQTPIAARGADTTVVADTEFAPAPSAPVAVAEPRMPAPRQAVSHYGGSRSSAVHVDFNRDRQEITFRLRYTTAIVSAFGVLALVGMAYVVGRHISHGPQTASAAETVDSRPIVQQAPQPSVTEVPHSHPVHPVVDNSQQVHHDSSNTSSNTQRNVSTVSLVPASAETGMPRAIGLNYAIIQTYPPDETKSAEDARDFLTQHGIPCTLEKTDYVRNDKWVCLVGTAGFAKISSGDFKTYADNIVKLGEKFPSSRFDKFKPQAYKWKGSTN